MMYVPIFPLGSVRDLVSSSGTELDHIAYDSYGNILSESNAANGDRFKYAGMQDDGTIGLYFDQARWYDPGVGRFVNRDPKGFDGGDYNLYLYVHNGPTNYIDPSGMNYYGGIGGGGGAGAIGAVVGGVIGGPVGALVGGGLGTIVGGIAGYFTANGVFEGASKTVWIGVACGGFGGFYGAFVLREGLGGAVIAAARAYAQRQAAAAATQGGAIAAGMRKYEELAEDWLNKISAEAQAIGRANDAYRARYQSLCAQRDFWMNKMEAATNDAARHSAYVRYMQISGEATRFYLRWGKWWDANRAALQRTIYGANPYSYMLENVDQSLN
jgi:RHS repeat-associated protein